MDNARIDKAFSWLALAYALLLAVPLGMPGAAGTALLLADALAPLMLCQLWRKRREAWALLAGEGRELALLGGWAVAACGVQLLRREGGVHDLAVLGYMAVLYVFYRVTPMPRRRWCVAGGAAALALIGAGWLLTRGGIPEAAWLRRLLFIDERVLAYRPGALGVRYTFLFQNPNLLGSAYFLPVLLILPALRRGWAGTPWRGAPGWVCTGVAAILSALLVPPVLSTGSKHILLTLALLGGAASGAAWLRPLRPRWLCAAALCVLGALCWCTIWFRSYPAVGEAPWVDFGARGNYFIHHQIYARVVAHGGVGGWLAGFGEGELRRRYPREAELGRIREILSAYGAADMAEQYATYMDPHNGYLDLAAHFGVPALLLMLLFLGRLGWRACRLRLPEAAFFLLALAFALMWDDLFSKRWIWVGLALLAGTAADKTGEGDYI